MWKCNRCGDCCNPPRLFSNDIKRIKKLGFKEKDFVYTDNLGNTYMKDGGGWCVFLIKSKPSSCRIYEARPETCRLYPTELINGSCKPEKLAFDDYLEKKKNG